MKGKPLKFEELCLTFAISHVWPHLSLKHTHIGLLRGLIFFLSQASPFYGYVGVTSSPPSPLPTKDLEYATKSDLRTTGVVRSQFLIYMHVNYNITINIYFEVLIPTW